jgi:methyl-accepting chemotaxis protein-2 (aspartate sensor receptor)
MTVRLSWFLVLGTFFALILVLSGLGLYLLAVSSAAMTDLAAQAGDAGAHHLQTFAALSDTLRLAILGVLAVAVLTTLVVVWGVTVNVLRPLSRVVMHFDTMAKGDLSAPIEHLGNNEIGRLYGALEALQTSLGRTVGAVRHGSDAIHQGSQHIASGNQDLSARTEEQAAALQETAASMEQLASTVKQNADNARHASQLAEDASRTAGNGGQVVDEVVATMHEIRESSHRVSDIIKVIDSIAFQTNILALNASVEAARAGEQGRGFAVVAGEVRNLAQRSADASRQIRELIEVSVARVEAGSERADRAGSTMGDIVAAVQKVSDIMDEIAAASAEQSSGIDQVNLAVAQMDEVTQQNAALVQQAAAVAHQVESQAERLSQAVAGFRLDGKSAEMPPSDAAAADGAESAGDAGHDPTLARWMPALMPSPAGRDPQTKTRGHASDQEWESF